jgi:hypothetical protein
MMVPFSFLLVLCLSLLVKCLRLRVEWSQERFYFGDNVLPCFESGIPLLKHRLHQLPDANNVRSSITCQMQIVRFHHISCILHTLAGLVVPSVEKAGWTCGNKSWEGGR